MNQIEIGKVTEAWAKSQKLHVKYFKETASTNTVAKTEAFTEDSLENEFSLYLTDSQTAGRGRFDRTWSMSKKGAQLLSSWSFQPTAAPLPTTTALIGLGLFTAAKATWPFLNWSLKAPNDLFLDDKKVAGLLVETVSQGSEFRMIIGLGFNVLSSPEDVPTSTALIHHLSKETPLLGEDWIGFLERLLFEFSACVQLVQEPLNSTQNAKLIYCLNKNPLLKNKIKSAEELSEELWR